MHFKKSISVWALLALIFGQLILAQHNAVHIEHGFSQEIASFHDGHKHDHDEEEKEHQCPECLLTETLNIGFYHHSTIVFMVPTTSGFTLQEKSDYILSARYQANLPRAPPVVLI